MKKLPAHTAGFSLIQISLMLTVMSILVVSVLPGGENGNDLGKDSVTSQRMARIEEATKAYMAKNLHRPCPADAKLPTSDDNFGIAAPDGGYCGGTSPAATFVQSPPLTITGSYNGSDNYITSLTSTANIGVGMFANGNDVGGWVTSIDGPTQVTINQPSGSSDTADSILFYSAVAGGVPTRTLGLPDEYALDGYGRRMQYVVDLSATRAESCHDLQSAGSLGNVHIKDTISATNNTDSVMWALMSYGRDGHGAFPANGGAMASRFDTGATDTDTANNAFAATGSMGTSTFSGTLVRKEKTSAADGKVLFDDKVWYSEPTKNTCCVGKMCNFGTRIDGAPSDYLGSAGVAYGDINGDGITDMIISGSNNKLYVIFGRATDWAAPGSVLDLNGALNNKGIIITNNNPTLYANWLQAQSYGNGFAVGDVNGDGYDDIVMTDGDSSNSHARVFFGSAAPVSTTLGALTTTFKLPYNGGYAAPAVAVGNFKGSTNGTHAIKDIFVLTDSNLFSSTEGYLFYGNAGWGSGTSTNLDVTTTGLCVGTTGFRLSTSNISTTALALAWQMGDINGDGIDDFVFSGFVSGGPSNTIPVIFGRTDWSSDASACSGINSSNVDAVTQTGNAAKGFKITATSNTLGDQFLAVADINGDGKKDILYNYGASQVKVFYGQSGSSSYNSLTSSFGFFALASVRPTWVQQPFVSGVLGDINNDGKMDIILSDSNSSPPDGTNASAGSSFALLQPQGSDFKTAYGASFSIFGKAFKSDSSGLPLNDDVKQGFRIDGAVNYENVKTVGVADLNGDGKNDIILNSLVHNSNRGSVYILWGKGTVPWDESFDLSPLN